MKVYQMIYTSVKNSLSDGELGLSNQEGYRVYSLSQGITRENIAQILKFANYRLPKNSNKEYSKVVGDPSVPDMFPKTFRTLKLGDGKYAAVQTVFSGVDYQNNPGNFFAHILVFDEYNEKFFPEQYYGHSKFKKFLTTAEAEKQIVHYLPMMEDLKPTKGLEEKIITFIAGHKKEISYIINQALTVLTSSTKKHLCISSNSEELTSEYLVALKWILPREISAHTGISTYNVYLPSDKQDNIIFHGTITDNNNITEKAIEERENCIYIDVDKTDFSSTRISPILKFGVKELREHYAKNNFTSVTQLLDWVSTYSNITKPGMGAKLLHLQKSAGDEAFVGRATELYEKINDENMQAVKFEISKVMYDNISLFPELSKSITDCYMGQGIEKLCNGETYNMENILKGSDNPKEQAQLIREKFPKYMEIIRRNFDTIGQKNQLLLLRMFAIIKQTLEITTWKEFFNNKKDYIVLFIEMAASVTITGYGIHAFTTPANWTKSEMSEVIAYFESSTKDEKIKKACLKYILDNEDENWEMYGVNLIKHTKTKGEQEADMQKIKRMLAKVGYIPYQRNSYAVLRQDVTNEMKTSTSPLLLTKLLYAVYKWQSTYGNQPKAQVAAEKVKSLLLEMRKSERSCYDFVIPKLALEIIESPGHYHEVIINTETMPQSFWNWFLIGYKKCSKQEDKMIVYTRIYESNKKKMSSMPIRQRMRKTFMDEI